VSVFTVCVGVLVSVGVWVLVGVCVRVFVCDVVGDCYVGHHNHSGYMMKSFGYRILQTVSS